MPPLNLPLTNEYETCLVQLCYTTQSFMKLVSRLRYEIAEAVTLNICPMYRALSLGVFVFVE